MKIISPTRIWAARFIAMSADFIQIVLVPFYFFGGYWLDDVLDVFVGRFCSHINDHAFGPALHFFRSSRGESAAFVAGA
jgi:hypothetical protein